MQLLPTSGVKHCPVCDVEWAGAAPCWNCGEEGAVLPGPVTSSVEWTSHSERIQPKGVLTL